MLTGRSRVIAGLVTVVSMVAASCGGTATSRDPAGDVVRIDRVFEKVFARIARDSLGTTRASRIYANVSLAMLATQAPVDRGAAELLAKVDGFPEMKVPSRFDADIATVAAAASVARNLLPSASDRANFAQFRDSSIAEMSRDTDRETVASSLSFAKRVSAAVMVRASNDGSDNADSPLPGSSAVSTGGWVPTPPSLLPAIDPGWGAIRRFMKGTEKCVPAAPPVGLDPKSPYEEAAAFVKEMSVDLTDLQKTVARFWNDEGRGSGTTTGHWVNISLAVSAKKNRSVARTVTAAAGVAMASADAITAAWSSKYAWAVERPVTVIQRTDPSWQPYLETPATPGYPSARAAASRAAADILTHYLGETVFGDPGRGLTVRERSAQGIKTQYFESFRAAADQTALSRLYAGTDYRMSVRAGERLGGCVALKVTTGLAG